MEDDIVTLVNQLLEIVTRREQLVCIGTWDTFYEMQKRERSILTVLAKHKDLNTDKDNHRLIKRFIIRVC